MLCIMVLVAGLMSQLEIVTLMHDHERPRDRTIEGATGNRGPDLVEDNRLFDDRQRKFNNFRTRFGRLFMGMNERRRDKRHVLAWKFEIGFGSRRRRAERESANPQEYPFRQFHRVTPQKSSRHFVLRR